MAKQPLPKDWSRKRLRTARKLLALGYAWDNDEDYPWFTWPDYVGLYILSVSTSGYLSVIDCDMDDDPASAEFALSILAASLETGYVALTF